jgi:basic membrane protein A
MRGGKVAVLICLGLIGLVTAVQAQPAFVPGVIFDMGGKFDKSFNEAAYVGAERFKKETGIPYREFEVTNEGQREQALANMARRGVAIIAAIGFSQRAPVEIVAKQYPNVKFTIIDAVVDLPNVQSVLYREQEGAFLVGLLAAMKSRTGKIGFVGGMDIPLIRKFALGYEEGARFASPKIEVLQNMTGTTPAAWADPARGAELARSQFDRGADIVFAAAGTTGIGVLQAAKDAGKLSIGCDSNQNYLHPGSVLTSMIKRVDNAVYLAFKSARDGSWKPGTQILGLAEDGIGYAVDDNNAALITSEMTAKAEAAKSDIIAGRIKVTDYMAK